MVETNNDLLSGLYCPECDVEQPLLTSLGRVTEQQGRCPDCDTARVPRTWHTLDGSEAFLDSTLSELGIPPWDVLAGRAGTRQVFYEFAGDRAEVLGPMADDD